MALGGVTVFSFDSAAKEDSSTFSTYRERNTTVTAINTVLPHV